MNFLVVISIIGLESLGLMKWFGGGGKYCFCVRKVNVQRAFYPRLNF